MTSVLRRGGLTFPLLPMRFSPSDRFPRYTGHRSQVPLWKISAGRRGCIHRFFVTSPFSPSGRYFAMLQLPQEDRVPAPGEEARVLVADLHSGETHEVAATRGWENQLGANLNWGATDHDLFFNDVDTRDWTAHTVHLDPLSGRSRVLPGPVYHVSPDGRTLASANPIRMQRTQPGYGVVVPPERVGPRHVGFPADDGFTLTDVATGRTRFLSLAEIWERLGPRLDIPEPRAGGAYGFHSQWSPDGTRIMFTVRWVPATAPDWAPDHRDIRFNVLTVTPDFSELHVAIPARLWERGGHHTNWCPDSRHLLMNLGHFGYPFQLCRVAYDGSGLASLFETPIGSGHPTLHPDGRHILTDTYLFEKPYAWDDGSVPLRWIDTHTRTETEIARIPSRPPQTDGALRVDPHPAWDRTHRRIAVNAVIDGTRAVLVADLSALL